MKAIQRNNFRYACGVHDRHIFDRSVIFTVKNTGQWLSSLLAYWLICSELCTVRIWVQIIWWLWPVNLKDEWNISFSQHWVFWDVTPYSLVDTYEGFGGMYFLCPQGQWHAPPKCWYHDWIEQRCIPADRNFVSKYVEWNVYGIGQHVKEWHIPGIIEGNHKEPQSWWHVH